MGSKAKAFSGVVESLDTCNADGSLVFYIEDNEELFRIPLSLTCDVPQVGKPIEFSAVKEPSVVIKSTGLTRPGGWRVKKLEVVVAPAPVKVDTFKLNLQISSAVRDIYVLEEHLASIGRNSCGLQERRRLEREIICAQADLLTLLKIKMTTDNIFLEIITEREPRLKMHF
jgi:hypothetical protein